MNEAQPSLLHSFAAQTKASHIHFTSSSSPFNVFINEEDKGINGFSKMCRVPITIDRVQEAIARKKYPKK